jgi:serine protease Do
MQGELVGINTAIVPNAQGIGFAIPVNTAKPLIPQLVATGEVTRGYLGVNIQPITSELASALQLKDTEGALVADVVPGSPADKAGIKRGDVILAYNKKPVKESRDLPSMVAGTPVGDEAGVTLLRDGKESQLSVRIAKLRPEESGPEEPGQTAKGKWGMALQDVSPQVARKLGLKTEHGALVVNVQPESPAERAAIRKGDVILEVNRQPVSSVEECKDEISRAEGKDSLLLLLQRGQNSLYVALKG